MASIPASAPAATPPDLPSQARQLVRSIFATRRGFDELFCLHAISLPQSIGDAKFRFGVNMKYFAMSYAVFLVFCFFLSLIVNALRLSFGVFLYAALFLGNVLRDEPRVLLRHALLAATVFNLWLDGNRFNILAVLGGYLLVVAHATFRRTDDLFLEEAGRASVLSS